ncbi:hypothetical protein CHH78_02535 [Shouchella clausii]|uniref:hypothetical protein n=1 Tax=Shouchella clausii TaxID=79880 RepID=UPI000BA7DC0A|nr:hypothetical protein [Shouchella clausii]PAD10212.1 hypothetical protein CHH76_05725 [Shouchella clausii]PAE86194.1 hypothetical protein CHH78_02535 [Shouchella clausii]PAF06876.1 hypothetical protein CHH66_02530 [Shouchella clausii]
MNKNTTAYSLLYTIHDHLATKHHVPSHMLDSYRQTIIYVVPFYTHTPRVIELLNQSIRIRNKVCHFQPTSQKDIKILQLLCNELQVPLTAKKVSPFY